MAKRRERLTQSQVRGTLVYNQDTGEFLKRLPPSRRNPTARLVSCAYTDGKGYTRVSLAGASYPAHRLAWLYVKGYWPDQIDHIDRNKSNNRWANLREANNSQNQANTSVRKNNTSGFKGVYLFQERWAARITARGERIFLGYFDTAEIAHAAYATAAKNLHGEFGRAA